MSDLVVWLTKVLDEDEAIADAAIRDRWPLDPSTMIHRHRDDDYVYDDAGKHIARHDPASVLVDVVVKRAILALHQPKCPADTWYWLERECAGCGHHWHDNTPVGTPPTVIGPERGCPTVRLLASAYAARPGYREEWRP